MKYSLLVSLLTIAGAIIGQDSPDARAILDKVAQAGRTGRSYRAEFAGTLESTGTGMQQKVELGGTIIFQQPDKVRMEIKTGPVETLMVRNGTETYIYLPATKQYTKFTANPASRTNPDLSMLFGDVTADVRSAKLGADENLLFGGASTRCYVIQTESDLSARGSSLSASSIRSTLWIDQSNYMVLRRRSAWTTQAPRLRVPVETTMEFAVTNLIWSPPLTGAEFTFTPPTGATEMINRQGVPSGSAQAKSAGPERASIALESAPMYSKMSTASPVVVVLHKNDAVTIDFSVAGPNGGWCSVTQAVAGGKSGNVPCNSLQREPVVRLDTPSAAPAPAPVALTLPTARASRIPRAPPNIKVYFVPIGDLTLIDVNYLVHYYQIRYGLAVTPLPPIALDDNTYNPNRRQNEAARLIQSMGAAYPDLANDGRSILIGITEADIYAARENWTYAFGLRGGDRFAVVSSARMDLHRFEVGGVPNPNLLHRNLAKMLSREIGFMYYRLPFSSDPRSVVGPTLDSTEDLDQRGEDF